MTDKYDQREREKKGIQVRHVGTDTDGQKA
jgi:hypothetical protein